MSDDHDQERRKSWRYDPSRRKFLKGVGVAGADADRVDGWHPAGAGSVAAGPVQQRRTAGGAALRGQRAFHDPADSDDDLHGGEGQAVTRAPRAGAPPPALG